MGLARPGSPMWPQARLAAGPGPTSATPNNLGRTKPRCREFGLQLLGQRFITLIFWNGHGERDQHQPSPDCVVRTPDLRFVIRGQQELVAGLECPEILPHASGRDRIATRAFLDGRLRQTASIFSLGWPRPSGVRARWSFQWDGRNAWPRAGRVEPWHCNPRQARP